MSPAIDLVSDCCGAPVRLGAAWVCALCDKLTTPVNEEDGNDDKRKYAGVRHPPRAGK